MSPPPPPIPPSPPANTQPRQAAHRPEPTLIEVRRLPESRALRLTWDDGHAADYPYDYLRGWCPCAACQGHSNLKIHFRPAGMPVEAGAIQPVGNYAISVAWSDGHGTGIYRFGLLRDLCPCPACGGPGDAIDV